MERADTRPEKTNLIQLKRVFTTFQHSTRYHHHHHKHRPLRTANPNLAGSNTPKQACTTYRNVKSGRRRGLVRKNCDMTPCRRAIAAEERYNKNTQHDQATKQMERHGLTSDIAPSFGPYNAVHTTSKIRIRSDHLLPETYPNSRPCWICTPVVTAPMTKLPGGLRPYYLSSPCLDVLPLSPFDRRSYDCRHCILPSRGNLGYTAA